MAVTKITDLNSLFPLIYEDALFVMRDNNIMTGLVTVLPRVDGYATRTVGIWNSATVMEVADGVDFTTNTKFSQSSKATFSPSEKMAQFIVTDAMVSTAAGRANVRNQAANELGQAMAQKVDKDLIGVFASLGNSIGTANNAITKTIAAGAITLARLDNARGRGSFVWHPTHWQDLWVELGSPTGTYAFTGDVANEALRQYFVGSWIGADHFTSNNIDIDGSDDAVSAFFTREAIALDPRDEVSFEEERDASLRGWEINVHAGYAVGTWRAEHGTKITGDATAPS